MVVTEELPAPPVRAHASSFARVYEQYFAFAWRNLRRLGVAENDLRDAAQDVFLVIHRRLPEYDEQGSLRAWVYSIVRRVAADARRTRQRKQPPTADSLEQVPDYRAPNPEKNALQNEALRRLLTLLDALEPDKREVLVLVDLEGLSVPEVAELVGANLNTVYSRLRAARQCMREGHARMQARPQRP